MRNKNEIGLGPHELFFRGHQKVENVSLRVIDFNANDLVDISIDEVSDVLKFKNKNSVTWFNIDGLHDQEKMIEIAKIFDLDELVLSDIMNTDSRPKIREYDNCIFISIKMLTQNEKSNEISVENLSLVFTESVLISFQEKKGDVFDPIRNRLRLNKKIIRRSGTDYLTFALLDIVIDHYIHIISILGDKIDDLEQNFLMEPKKGVIRDINSYKKELNFFRKNIAPVKEMLLIMSKNDNELISENTDIHFKELIDNINQVIDSSNSYREVLSDHLNIYHTNISSKLNDTMKFLTIFSVIFNPLTFIAGIYGTNFDNIPELHYKYGYFVMLGAMLLVTIGMLFYFKRKNWL